MFPDGPLLRGHIPIAGTGPGGIWWRWGAARARPATRSSYPLLARPACGVAAHRTVRSKAMCFILCSLHTIARIREGRETKPKEVSRTGFFSRVLRSAT